MKTLLLGVRLNQLIWTKYFDRAWQRTPLDEKLMWMLFLTNTMAIITLIQIFAFKAL
ncbi:MAG TPA: hypothetical protein VJB96_05555 [Patescibacteria group bacterium]|nr:hypothetical protein [Patescibacteria group bacterium]